MDPQNAAHRMSHIATQLGQLYADQAEADLGLWRCEQVISDHLASLTPPGGWPGRTAEQRRLAQVQALATDRRAQQLTRCLSAGRIRLTRTRAAIARLEAERRALEWGVYADLARLLAAGAAPASINPVHLRTPGLHPDGSPQKT